MTHRNDWFYFDWRQQRVCNHNHQAAVDAYFYPEHYLSGWGVMLPNDTWLRDAQGNVVYFPHKQQAFTRAAKLHKKSLRAA